MGNNRRGIFPLIATIIFTISSLRLFEGVIKRELKGAEKDLYEEHLSLFNRNKELEEEIKKKELEKNLLSLQREMSQRKEPYLTIKRQEKVAQLKMEDKTLHEMRFSIKGRRAIAGEILLPMGVLKVQKKMENPTFYLPDWIFELKGKEIPKDTLDRKINDAFGKFIISLGGDICLSGKVREEIPEEVLDLIYLEFEKEDIERIFHTLKENSSVFFF
jgi:hypothetical protein|uniref:Uncharacterized protein n=1 Tax=candidate division WOR-3 bacterium TaxID=2052148 RepID=A0A7C3YV27_UNCW3